MIRKLLLAFAIVICSRSATGSSLKPTRRALLRDVPSATKPAFVTDKYVTANVPRGGGCGL